MSQRNYFYSLSPVQTKMSCGRVCVLLPSYRRPVKRLELCVSSTSACVLARLTCGKYICNCLEETLHCFCVLEMIPMVLHMLQYVACRGLTKVCRLLKHSRYKYWGKYIVHLAAFISIRVSLFWHPGCRFRLHLLLRL